MKKLMAYSIILVATLASCTGTRIATYNDDVYANPAEDRREQQRIAAENKKAQEAYQKRYNDSVAAVRTRENNNPYYKDPQYKSDDYYDYEYATRVKRFQNPVNGIGYYDNYYTNTYFYSGNPYQYGMSVYNGYNFWPSYNSYNYFPSSYFYNTYGWGSSMGFGYGNGFGSPYGYGYGSGYGYDPFGYNNAYWMGYNHGYNSGFWGYPYGSSFGGFGYPYGYGYGGYGNPYGWGYYNSYDQNSGYTYAPRSSHSGGSDSRMSNPGMSSNSSYYQNYVQKVVESQAKMQKFTEMPVVARSIENNGPYKQAGNGGMAPVYNTPANNPHYYSNPVNMPAQKNNIEREGRSNFNDQPNNVPFKQPAYSQPTYSQPVYSQPVKENPVYEAPPRQAPVRQQYEQPARNYEPPVFNNPPANNFPRGGGMEGGGGRPR